MDFRGSSPTGVETRIADERQKLQLGEQGASQVTGSRAAHLSVYIGRVGVRAATGADVFAAWYAYSHRNHATVEMLYRSRMCCEWREYLNPRDWITNIAWC